MLCLVMENVACPTKTGKLGLSKEISETSILERLDDWNWLSFLHARLTESGRLSTTYVTLTLPVKASMQGTSS